MGQAARGGSLTEMRLMLSVQLLPPRADLFLERGDVSAVPPTADRQLYDPRISRTKALALGTRMPACPRRQFSSPAAPSRP